MKNIKKLFIAFTLIFCLGLVDNTNKDYSSNLITQNVSAKKAYKKITKWGNGKRKMYKVTNYYKNGKKKNYKYIKYNKKGKYSYYKYIKYNTKGQKTYQVVKNYRSNGKISKQTKYWYKKGKLKNNAKKELRNYHSNGQLSRTRKYKYNTKGKSKKYFDKSYKLKKKKKISSSGPKRSLDGGLIGDGYKSKKESEANWNYWNNYYKNKK